ncbi:STAS/SEC14 domain-containing protein [Agromyces subbeticus]|uniref:STAS/SEC14 domain-containing protein n=1 Tax=Agromyces subbeticus TaxID=293890 RepID=UPI0003B38FFF|nr:STAS/SEC14 domain-containing protein [Agromyces subbeticus]
MIEPLVDLPDGVIGFRAIGTIDAADYRDVLVPAIDAVLAEHEHVNVVAVLGDDFDHLSVGAMWQDAKLVGLPLSSWGRAAIVTDHDVLAGVATAFGGLVPGGFRVFPLDQERAAINWAAEYPPAE